MFKLDLHTHSTGSPDGGLTLDDYRRALNQLDFIAITDHDEIATALAIQRHLGARIIVGSEISSADGDLIGLYLQSNVAPNQSVEATAQQIRQQGGLVLVPHPYQSRQRRGLNLDQYHHLSHRFDIIETYNGRSLPPSRHARAGRWAAKHQLATAAGSDAHGPRGLGRTYNLVPATPTRQNLVELLRRAEIVRGRRQWRGYLDPTLNRRRAKIEKTKQPKDK